MKRVLLAFYFAMIAMILWDFFKSGSPEALFGGVLIAILAGCEFLDRD